MDCFGTYSKNAQTCDNVRVQSAKQWTASVHTLQMPKPVIMLQSATQWIASVHTLHMPKPAITFVLKALRNFCFGAYFTDARYILYTCPHLGSIVCV